MLTSHLDISLHLDNPTWRISVLYSYLCWILSGSQVSLERLSYFSNLLIIRINAKPRRRCKNFQRMDSVSSDQWVRGRSYSGHTTTSNVSRSNLGVVTNNNIVPNLGLSSPVNTNYSPMSPPSSTTVTLHRVSSYTSPYCISPRTPSTTSSLAMTSYPVVTPSATSFAGPRPVPVPITLPHANYSDYCTAGNKDLRCHHTYIQYLSKESDILLLVTL